MKKGVHTSIRKKLAVIIAVTVAVALTFSAAIGFAMNYYLLRLELVRNGRAMSDLLAVALEDPEVRSNSESSFAQLSVLSHLESVSHAFFTDPDGIPQASYIKEGYDPISPPTNPDNLSYTFGPSTLDVFTPVVVDGQVLGVVTVRLDLDSISGYLGGFAAISIIGLLAALCLATLLSWRWISILTDPLMRLTHLARRVSREGNYKVRAEKEHEDELGELVDGFNVMLSQIEQRDGELQRARDLLEERVEERTQDLIMENAARKAAQEALRLEKEAAQQYLDVAAVILLALDPSGKVLLINKKGCLITGYTEDELLGKDWVDFIIPEKEREKARKNFNTVFKYSSVTDHYFESSIHTASGEKRLIAWHSTFLEDSEGNKVAALSSGEDITQRRQAQDREEMLNERLQRSERLESIGLLAGGVAHDLNNMLGPLTSLPLLMVEDIEALCNGDKSVAGQIKDDLMEISSSANRAALTIKDLMALSRSNNSEKSDLSLNNIVNEFVDTHEFQDLQRSFPEITIDLDLTYPLPQISASQTHIIRILSNLSRNGLEAMSAGGVLTIHTRVAEFDEEVIKHEIIDSGVYVVLAIADTGSGVPPDAVGKIFDPFFTSKSMGAHSGSGLGLSIVHSIVKDHKGYIDLLTYEGSGTRFELYFPVKTAVNSDTIVKMASGGKEKVLIVDDDRAQRFVARRVLEKFGYEVTEAENGSEAVRLYEGSNVVPDFDIVLMDMVMEPDLDGLAALERILAVKPEQRSLIVSGFSAVDRAEKAKELGAGWVSKPYDNQTIGKAVRDTLDA